MEINIKDFTPKFNQMFFFDNNIWMFLFSPIGNYQKIKQSNISNFLQLLKSTNCDIVLNSLVLSEFSNANLKLDFKLWKEETKNYNADYKKDYLLTPRYKNTVDVVASCINQILKLSERYSDSFNAINTNNLLTLFVEMDFNDAYYLEICTTNKWILVSDDNDFKKVNHSILILKP